MQNTITWQNLLQDALIKSLPEMSLVASDLPSGDRVTVSVTVEGNALQGTVYVICAQSFLERTCPISDNDPEVLEDWTAELANLILGRFKNLLLGQGVTIKIHPPRKEKGLPAGTVSLSFEDHGHKIAMIANLAGTPELTGKNIAELMPGEAVYRLNEPVHLKKNYDVIAKIRSGIESDQFNDDLEEEVPDWNEEEKDIPAVVNPQHLGRERRDLEGVSWDKKGLVRLLFSGNLSCTFSPAVLLSEGCNMIELEGYKVQVDRVAGEIQVTIPELRITFMQPERMQAA